jgi:hypothetical protein
MEPVVNVFLASQKTSRQTRDHDHILLVVHACQSTCLILHACMNGAVLLSC